MTFDWGYLTGTVMFLPGLVVLVTFQIVAKKFHPFLYWATIVASTIFSTTMADFADRSLGIGYSGGSALLLGLLLTNLAAWYWTLGSISLAEHCYSEERGVLLGGDNAFPGARNFSGRLDGSLNGHWL